MTRGLWIAAVALIVGSGCEVERTISGRRDFTVDPTLKYKEVAFKDIVRSPASYKGLDVQFEAMFYKREETVWSHFYTPFHQDDYVSFSVWPLDARIWELDGHLGSVPTLYVRKTNDYMTDFLECEAYSRVIVKGNIRSDYETRPWIEVHRVEMEQQDIFTPESLRNLISGLTDASERRPALARERLEKAIQGPMSNEAHYVANMTLGRLYEEANNFVRAEYFFDRALDHKPEDAAAKEGVERNQRFEERRRQIEENKAKEKP